MTPAAKHALLIRAAIQAAREEGVNVTLDWDEDEDGMHVSMVTSVHRRLPSDDGKVMIMRVIDGPFIVEGC